MTKEVLPKKPLIEYDGDDQVISLQALKLSIDQHNYPVMNVKSQIPALDRLVEGFEEGELILLSGPPKSGKTLFLQTLTNEFAEQKVHTLWFSYELTPKQFIARYPGEFLPIAYMPAKMKSNAMAWIDERILEAKLKYSVRVVMIDHLHYIVDMAKLRNPSLEIGAILRALKQIALKYLIVVFVICHTAKIESGKQPGAEDIRDSSFCSQEPDTVLIIWRQKDNDEKHIKDQARLKVAMTRRTGVLGKTIRLIKGDGLLRELVEM